MAEVLAAVLVLDRFRDAVLFFVHFAQTLLERANLVGGVALAAPRLVAGDLRLLGVSGHQSGPFGNWVARMRAATVLIWLLEMAKPIPEACESPSWGSSAASVGMPITRAPRSTSAPPELPGLIAALVWIAEVSVTPSPSETLRLTAEMMPSVTLECRPSGLPMASVMSPTLIFEESANPAGGGVAPVMWITARSVPASVPTIVAGTCLPLASVTVSLVAPATTWALVTMSPWES